jgi:3-hydroxybutyryl-CoA dehydratase
VRPEPADGRGFREDPRVTAYPEKRFDQFRVGDHAETTKTFTQEDVETFARLSNDAHPLHLDETYAATTRFGARVVHGMLTASLLSAANALLLGTPGAISLEQTLRFVRPVFAGDTITARSEVVELLPERRQLRCRTTCVNQRGEVVLTGTAIEQKDA